MSSSNRREYLTATSLSQGLLDRNQDNLDFRLEMAATIETPDGVINSSDRNKYVGITFYEALNTFPVISRSMGDWLSPTIEFSTLSLVISNVDGRFNKYIAGGASYGGWINKEVNVQLGLLDKAATYFKIFKGRVTDIGGFQRDRMKITLFTRDDFDRASVVFPREALTQTSFPDLEDSFVGTVVPVIYGDYTVGLRTATLIPTDPTSPTQQVPVIPSMPVNGKSTTVLAGTSEVRFLVAANILKFIDLTQMYLKRSDSYYKINTADITLGLENRVFDLKQGGCGGTTLIGTALYQFASGDQVVVRVIGKDLGVYTENIVEQARDILTTYTEILPTDLDGTWDTFRDKSSPAQSNISDVRSRVWIKDPEGTIGYVLSMLEQVRLEAFVSTEQKFSLSSLHFEEFVASPDHIIRNWDIEQDTLQPKIDDQNIWNRAQGSYDRAPDKGETEYETSVFRNDAAIAQMGKAISKRVVFPNLYRESDVVYQLKEMLRLASAGSEMIEVTLTPRSALQDLSRFVMLNVNIGSTIYQGVPAMIRTLGYDPKGISIPVKLWSMQLVKFPGWDPGYSGIVGGYDATIFEEI